MYSASKCHDFQFSILFGFDQKVISLLLNPFLLLNSEIIAYLTLFFFFLFLNDLILIIDFLGHVLSSLLSDQLLSLLSLPLLNLLVIQIDQESEVILIELSLLFLVYNDQDISEHSWTGWLELIFLKIVFILIDQLS